MMATAVNVAKGKDEESSSLFSRSEEQEGLGKNFIFGVGQNLVLFQEEEVGGTTMEPRLGKETSEWSVPLTAYIWSDRGLNEHC